MNIFLKEVGLTYRRDINSGRPRVNKPDSKVDREQKEKGQYYYVSKARGRRGVRKSSEVPAFLVKLLRDSLGGRPPRRPGARPRDGIDVIGDIAIVKLERGGQGVRRRSSARR